MQWKDKYAVITGGSSGIGEALAKSIAKRKGVPVLIARSETELQRVQKEIQEAYGISSPFLSSDLTDPEDRVRIKEFLHSFPRIDAVIHNAGITNHGLFEISTEEALRKTFEINFFAIVELMRILFPKLKEDPERRKIIGLVSTPSGLYGIPERFAYSSSKAAAQVFLESIYHELRQYNVGICFFYPGYTRTNLRKKGLTSDGKPLNEEPEKHSRSPEEVAEIIVRAIEKEKRYTFTNRTGRFIFYARVFFPGLLDSLLQKRQQKKKSR